MAPSNDQKNDSTNHDAASALTMEMVAATLQRYHTLQRQEDHDQLVVQLLLAQRTGSPEGVGGHGIPNAAHAPSLLASLLAPTAPPAVAALPNHPLNLAPSQLDLSGLLHGLLQGNQAAAVAQFLPGVVDPFARASINNLSGALDDSHPMGGVAAAVHPHASLHHSAAEAAAVHPQPTLQHVLAALQGPPALGSAGIGGSAHPQPPSGLAQAFAAFQGSLATGSPTIPALRTVAGGVAGVPAAELLLPPLAEISVPIAAGKKEAKESTKSGTGCKRRKEERVTVGTVPRPPRPQPAFPEILHRVLVEAEDKCHDHIISFNTTGDALLILDRTALIDELAPKYFRFRSMASFRRQLCLYGFVRFDFGERSGYRHEFFRRDRPDLLSSIQRTYHGRSKRS